MKTYLYSQAPQLEEESDEDDLPLHSADSVHSFDTAEELGYDEKCFRRPMIGNIEPIRDLRVAVTVDMQLLAPPLPAAFLLRNLIICLEVCQWLYIHSSTSIFTLTSYMLMPIRTLYRVLAWPELRIRSKLETLLTLRRSVKLKNLAPLSFGSLLNLCFCGFCRL